MLVFPSLQLLDSSSSSGQRVEMRSHKSSPKPELVRMRTFRLEGALEPPVLPPHQLFSPSMNLSSSSVLFSDSSSSHRQNDAPITPSTPSSRHVERTPTPTRTSNSSMPTQHSFPPRVESLSPPKHLQGVQVTDTTSVESNEWSSAVGRASTGKSGRVIEKLMGEVEKLRRENKLLTVKYDEEARRSESARALAESLQVSNANLSSICEASNSALARKDRKIEELKADLETECARRIKTEAENKAITQERDEVVAACKKELLEEKEVAKKSSSQYEALSSSWRRLDDGYRCQMEKLQQDLKALEDERVQDQVRFEEFSSTFSVLSDQAAASKAERDHILEQFEKYKQDKEDSIREMREAAERSQVDNDKALQEMKKVVGQMRYVMNVKRDVKGLD